MDEDLTIQLLKDVLALHGLAGYGGDYKCRGLVERGVYYTGVDGDLDRKAANHIDCNKMDVIDQRIIKLLELHNKDE